MLLPLLDPAEMANANIQEVATRLARTPYVNELREIARAPLGANPLQAAGPGPTAPGTAAPAEAAAVPHLQSSAAPATQSLVTAAAAALERFELEDSTFHPYTSRFDDYLRGTATLSPDELEGFRLFQDPSKGNCIACHTATTGPGGSAPTFTDHSYHALGVPRNPAIPANTDPRFFDLGDVRSATHGPP